MNLAAGLAAVGWTEEKLADELRRLGFKSLNQSTVNRIKNRTRKASLDLALTIEHLMNGKVRAEELPLSRRARVALRALRASQTLATEGDAA